MPHLVLPEASGSLGRTFGCKTMAAFAICPRPTPAPEPEKVEHLKAEATSVGDIVEADGRDRSRVGAVSAAAPSSELAAPPEGGSEGGGQVSPGAALERQTAAEEQAGASGGRLPVDDDVDSFVDFLRQKVKAPA